MFAPKNLENMHSWGFGEYRSEWYDPFATAADQPARDHELRLRVGLLLPAHLHQQELQQIDNAVRRFNAKTNWIRDAIIIFLVLFWLYFVLIL